MPDVSKDVFEYYFTVECCSFWIFVLILTDR